MSFILDALRKSESERQQDAAPSIARIPSAMPQHGLPAWAVATMAALGLGVVVLAGAWVKTLSGPESSSVALAPVGDESVDAEARYAGVGDRPQEGVTFDRDRSSAESSPVRRIEPLPLPPATGSSFSQPASSPARDLGDPSPLAAAAGASEAAGQDVEPAPSAGRAPSRTAGASPLAGAAQPSALAMAARTQTGNLRSSSAAPRPSLPAVEGVPEPYHSVAPSLGLPPLTLELLAYPEDPAKQFVFINGSRYAAGDTLPEGARVIAINARGAVLLVQGRQLQLEQR